MTEHPLDNPALAEQAVEIRRLGTRVVLDVIEIGRRLVVAKDLAGPGNWMAWLEREFKWSISTAENYINLFKLSASFPTVGNVDLDFRSLYLLAAPSTPQAVRAEILARAEAGEPVTSAEVKTAIAVAKPAPAEACTEADATALVAGTSAPQLKPEAAPELTPTAMVRTEPKPKPRHGINAAVIPLFKNEDRLDAFCAAVTTRAAKRFISLDQQLELAQDIVKRRISAQRIEPWISMWVREAARQQGRIDEVETKDLYKDIPGYEIRDQVAEAKSSARALIGALLKLENLWKKLPQHPFFGDLGGTLDGVLNMIRQWRRAAGEESADELERKLSKVQEFERKIQTLEITVTELRRENEELRKELAKINVAQKPDAATPPIHHNNGGAR